MISIWDHLAMVSDKKILDLSAQSVLVNTRLLHRRAEVCAHLTIIQIPFNLLQNSVRTSSPQRGSELLARRVVKNTLYPVLGGRRASYVSLIEAQVASAGLNGGGNARLFTFEHVVRRNRTHKRDTSQSQAVASASHLQGAGHSPSTHTHTRLCVHSEKRALGNYE